MRTKVKPSARHYLPPPNIKRRNKQSWTTIARVFRGPNSIVLPTVFVLLFVSIKRNTRYSHCAARAPFTLKHNKSRRVREIRRTMWCVDATDRDNVEARTVRLKPGARRAIVRVRSAVLCVHVRLSHSHISLARKMRPGRKWSGVRRGMWCWWYARGFFDDVATRTNATKCMILICFPVNNTHSPITISYRKSRIDFSATARWIKYESRNSARRVIYAQQVFEYIVACLKCAPLSKTSRAWFWRRDASIVQDIWRDSFVFRLDKNNVFLYLIYLFILIPIISRHNSYSRAKRILARFECIFSQL